MYDTIKFGFSTSPQSSQLQKWDMERKDYHISCKSRSKYETRLSYRNCSIHVIYYPQDINNRPKSLLLFEMSLPKLVFGDNVHMIDSPEQAIEIAHKVIDRNDHVPNVDLYQGILYRIDLCYNFGVGDNVSEWIKQLFKLEYPRRKTKPYYPSQGVQYYSKTTTLSFYDKEEETKHYEAHGILRMESSCREKTRIGNLVGRQSATIKDFTPAIAHSLLNNELDKLGIKDRVPGDSLATLRTLIEKYGPEQGMRMFGYVSARQIASSKQIKTMGMTKQTLSRNNKLISNAGLTMSLTQNETGLPKLVIAPKGLVE